MYRERFVSSGLEQTTARIELRGKAHQDAPGLIGADLARGERVLGLYRALRDNTPNGRMDSEE